MLRPVNGNATAPERGTAAKWEVEMAVVRNVLAVIGVVALLGGGYAVARVWPIYAEIEREFDPGYMEAYVTFATRLLESKDPGVAMMYSIPVEDGLTVADVKDSLKSIANERNFLFVGEAPFHQQVTAITGEPYRHVSFMSFCDAQVGRMMADYRDAYTGFMPCRIAVVEGLDGRLWLHSMNLDLMIHGGKELPPDLKSEAIRVWETIQAMMQGAAAGEF